jgi:hypothetical protein
LVRTSSQDVVRQLYKAVSDLGTLIRQVGMYVHWWDQKVTDFKSLENLTEFIAAINNNTISKEDVHDRWRDIRTQYYNYKQQVG